MPHPLFPFFCIAPSFLLYVLPILLPFPLLLPLLVYPSFWRACHITPLFISLFLPCFFYWHTRTFFISLVFVVLQHTPLFLLHALPNLSRIHTHFPFFVLHVLPHTYIISLFPYFNLSFFFYHVTTHTFFPFFLFMPCLSSHAHSLPLFLSLSLFFMLPHTHTHIFFLSQTQKWQKVNI